MTEQTPAQLLASQISSLSTKIGELQTEARLSSLRDSLEDLDGQTSGLRPCIYDLRERGYVFGKGLEARADGLSSQWRSLRPGVLREIERQAPLLASELSRLEPQLAMIQSRAGNPAAAKPAADTLERSLETLESKIDAVARDITGMFNQCQTDVRGLKSTLDRVGQMLERFAGASFRLLPTEGAVMAVKAVYSRDAKIEKEDPDGFLFLTDQRLLFEQNEEVATKKVLFITTAKEKVQKLLLDAPVALVQDVQASKKGLFGHEDHLALTFQSGAPVYQAWFHLDGQDCNEWQQLIGQSRSGELEKDRAVAIDKEEVRKVKEAPAQCPNCGAPMTQVVLRGMESITCAYCQFVIRL
jgi:hypothetical protein